jgi:triosephosphate isomerase
MPRRLLIAGNWKMNGLGRDGRALAAGIAAGARMRRGGGAELLVCPPATLLSIVKGEIAGSAVTLGAQDCHAAPAGAHTGDVSAPMLADLGCRYVILGHSERRADHREDDAAVRAKAAAARAAGLVAIVCVGETLAERDAGRTLEVVGRQLAGSIPDGATPADAVVAYEPVWAIGTGRVATRAQVAEVHAAIRDRLGARFNGESGFRILYGGSVKPENAVELLGLDDVDGALVGGASLRADSFLAIADAAPRRPGA